MKQYFHKNVENWEYLKKFIRNVYFNLLDYVIICLNELL